MSSKGGGMSKTRGNNLFAVDPEAITRVLADANAILLEKQRKVLGALRNAPTVIENEKQLSESYELAQAIKDLSAEIRSARLSDGRPFRVAVNHVKSFFLTRSTSR